MGIWRFAGAFAVVERQKEMRAQRPLNARQPADAHRRVLCASSLLQLVCFQFSLKFSRFRKKFPFLFSRI